MYYRWFKSYLGVTFGVFLTALGLDAFLVPAKIAAGGVSGIATILYYMVNLPVGAVMLALNIPLFIWSSLRLGWRSTVNSLYGMITLSLFIDLLAPHMPLITEDLLLASLYGGVLMGIGLGLVFRFNGTTGGTVLAAAIVRSYVGINVGQLLFLIDAIVVVWAGVVFQSVELAMYALITIFLTSWIIDRVLEGFSSAKAFIIITSKAEAVGDAINKELDRGATAWKGKGMYTGMEREVILTIVGVTQVTKLKAIVQEQDPGAFVILAHVSEVLGEGFQGLEGKK
ncbi:YitT family protein [Desulforamulus aquiferis]|uniref:YitT family protein n=1 Tax=Desulforamulus aquiferis TaxID=1397668 RepID=A0AAW7ZE02_9FIRM|nr:YitT family protein [Desulforamulus aquiferis]MDO7787943.1 YitT family protein [Desulforamulus aquiferis]